MQAMPAGAKKDNNRQSLPAHRALPPMAALRAFDAVARLNGIRRAAEALAIDHSAISRQVRSLETRLGATLVERDGARTILTEAGRTFHAAIGPALETIAAASFDASRAERRNRLNIWCAPAFAVQWLSPRFTAFRDLHPELAVELRPSDRIPDFFSDEADVGIAYFPEGAFAKSDRIEALEICNPKEFPVASPAYLAQHASIERAADLLRHPIIHEATEAAWRRWFAANGVSAGQLEGPKLWQGHLTMQAARQDQGIALATSIIAGDDIEAGRLVIVAGCDEPFTHPHQGPYIFLARKENWNARPVERFRSWLIDQIGASA